METIIKKKTTAELLAKMLDRGDLINIRFYEPANKSQDFFNITIRHGESQTPSMLFRFAKAILTAPTKYPLSLPDVLGTYYKSLTTEDHIFYVNYQEGDENGNVKMFDLEMHLISDNYFAYGAYFEAITEGKYTWASRTTKENIRLYKEANPTEFEPA